MKKSRRNFLSQSAGVATSLAIASRTWAQTAGKQGGTLTIGSQGMRTLNPAIQPGNATGIPGAQIFMGQATEYEIANVVDPNFTVVAKVRKNLLPKK